MIMNIYNITCTLISSEYDFSLIFSQLNSFNVKEFNRKGDFGKVKPYDFNFLELEFKENNIQYLTDFLKELLIIDDITKDFEVEKIIHINIEYITQCNFELNPLDIHLLNRLKASFSITCYKN